MASTKVRPRRPARPPATTRRSNGFPMWAALAAVIAVLLVVVVVTGDGSGNRTTPSAGEGLAHVHGLGVNPANADLYAASHFGVFRIPPAGEAERVGKLVQDTMGFTVVGPDHFLGSGHPDVNDDRLRKPGRRPLLGLVESTDGGQTWEALSLLGEADFHSLVAAHGTVYGHDSTGGRFMVSADGEQWDTRSRVGIGDFGVDPADPDHVVATTERGLAESVDGGRTWQPVDAPHVAFLSWGADQGLWGVSPAGETYQRVDGRWERRQALGGEPQTLLVTDEEIYAAVTAGDGTEIHVSSDAGRSWRLRYSENEA